MSEKRVGKYPDAVRRQAVKLVVDHRGEYESEWAAITSIAEKSGMTAETLRKWVRQAEIDDGERALGSLLVSRSGCVVWSGRTVSCGGQTRS